jgi:multiple sugar transport system permease protein
VGRTRGVGGGRGRGLTLVLAPVDTLLDDLGLLDSYAALLLPGLTPAFGVLLFRQAMGNAVPATFLESARIDGAGEFRFFLHRAARGAADDRDVLMSTFLGLWNNFIGPQIVLPDPARSPLAVAINQLRGLYGTDYGLIMSGTRVAIAPVMALFLLLQQAFIARLTSGAVKGEVAPEASARAARSSARERASPAGRA